MQKESKIDKQAKVINWVAIIAGMVAIVISAFATNGSIGYTTLATLFTYFGIVFLGSLAAGVYNVVSRR